MAPAMVIDLGEISTDAARMPRARDSGRVRRLLRIAWIVGVALAVVATLTGSAIQPRKPFAITARIPVGVNAHLLIDGTHAILLDDFRYRNEISSYALSGGRQEWVAAVTGTAAEASIALAGSTVVATMPHSDGEGGVINVFDVRTGRLLWQRDAQGVVVRPGDLLIEQPPEALPDVTVSLVDPVTGVAHWTLAIPPTCRISNLDDGAQVLSYGLVEFCTNTSEISVIDMSSGLVRLRRSVDVVPRAGSNPKDKHVVGVLAIGSVTVLVTIDNAPRLSLSAFRTSDLKPIWSGLSVNANDGITTCGVKLCLVGAEGINVVDTQTGHQTVGSPVPPDLLLAGSTRPVVIPKPVLVVVADAEAYALARTGKVPFSATPVPPGKAVNAPVWDPQPGSPWIAEASASAVTMLQPLPGEPADGCQSIAGYIVCANSGDQLTFWHRV